MKTRRLKKMRTRFLTGLLSVGLAFGLAGSAGANPSGPTVRHGEVNITGGTNALIQQLTDRAIVDWQSFSIGSGESVQFLQPSQLSVILNRVTGGDASEILGQLTANGNIFLINPNGILFGPTSTVSVGGLVASSLNITDQDFLAGNYSFFQDENRDLAAVVNQGRIDITDAGYAVLVAPTVINEGTIVARAGNIVLASGEQATLNLDGRDLVHFSLNGEVSEGTVLLAPGMMSDAVAQTLGVASSRRADKLTQMPDGSYRLENSSGTLVQAGTVSADGRDNVNAGNVLLDSADYTLLATGSLTSASGQGVNSSAGEVRVLSDMSDALSGLTEVRGGTVAAAGGLSGDAGFIEVSGDRVKFQGEIDFTHAQGEGGTFLLDPDDVFIVETDPGNDPANTYFEAGAIEGILNGGNDFIVQSTSQSIQLLTDIIATSGDGKLFLYAGDDPDTVPVETGTFIDLYDNDINIAGELILLATDYINIGAGTINADDGLVFSTEDGAITIGDATLTTDDEMRISAGGFLDIADGASLSSTLEMRLEADGLINIGDNASIHTDNQMRIMSDTGDIDVGTATITSEVDVFVTTGGGSIDLGTTNITANQMIELIAETDVFLNDSTLTADHGMLVSTGGGITGNGVNIDTRGVLGVPSDSSTPGGSIYLTSFTGDVILQNATLLFDLDAVSSATLSIIAPNGDIEISDSLLESDFAENSSLPGVRDYFSDIIFDADNITLTETDVYGSNVHFTASGTFLQNVTNDSVIEATNDFTGAAGTFEAENLVVGSTMTIFGDSIILDGGSFSANQIILNASGTGGTVSLTNANLTTDQRPDTTPLIQITADQEIDGDPQSLSGLHSARIILNSLNGGIDVAIDSYLDGNPGDSVPTSLTVQAAGNVVVNDIAEAANAQGFRLIRRSPGELAVESVNGDVSITTPSVLLLGAGDGSSVGDSGGDPIIRAGGSVLIEANSIVDRNSLPSPGSFGQTEIEAGGSITLEGFNGVGAPDLHAAIDVETDNLTVKAEGSGAPINVRSNEDLEFIDVKFNGGDVQVMDNGGGSIIHDAGGTGLRMNQGPTFLNDAVIRITALDDVAVHDFEVVDQQVVVLNAANGASIFNGSPASPNPNISTSADSFLAIFADGDIGSQGGFLTVETDHLRAQTQGVDSNIFLNLSPATSTSVTLEGVDPGLLPLTTDPLTSLTLPVDPATLRNQQGDILIDVAGDLALPGAIYSDGGNVSIDATGDVDSEGFSLAGSGATLLIQANSLTGPGTGIFADNLGLSLSQDYGAPGNLISISQVGNIFFGDTPGTGYYILANTEAGGDVRVTGSGNVRGLKSISGNQVDSLHLETNRGSIFVDADITAGDDVFLHTPDQDPDHNVTISAEVDAANRARVRATGNIIQGNNGLLEATDVVLEAGGNIGAINTDQMISASTLAAAAGTSLYVQNIGPELEIVNDPTDLPVVQAGQDFRVRSNLNTLTVSTDISAQDIALVTGTNLQIPAQIIPPDIVLNNNVTATNNLVVLAGGNIVQNGGTLTANQLGLGANGTVGTPGNPININTTDLALFSTSSELSSTPNPVNQVTAVQVTVNQGSPSDPGNPGNPGDPGNPVTPPTVVPPGPPPPNPDGEPQNFFGENQFPSAEEFFNGSEFAQNDVGLVDEYTLEIIGAEGTWSSLYGQVLVPIDWWDDEDFLKKKFRRKSKK